MNALWESADGTVKKEILKNGVLMEKPTEGSRCVIDIQNVEADLPADVLTKTLHSKILQDAPHTTIVIGEANSDLDRRIERAIQTMLNTERSLVTVCATLEDDGSVFCKVTFVITLVKFESHSPIWEWTPEEKYKLALKHKDRGNELFKECRYIDAFHKFSKACKILITLEPIADLELEESLDKNIHNLRAILYNNMAGCHLNRGNFEHTVTLCTKILNKDESNVKALYRRGVAYGRLKNVEKAVIDLKQVLTLEPRNILAKEQFEIYDKKWQIANEKSKDMVRRMFKT